MGYMANSEDGASAVQIKITEPSAPSAVKTLIAYCNGGCFFKADEVAAIDGKTLGSYGKVLEGDTAVAPDAENQVALANFSHGNGHVVLFGVHVEYLFQKHMEISPWDDISGENEPSKIELALSGNSEANGQYLQSFLQSILAH
jgi:glutamine amidotransferase-like uncharacterized protein